MLLLVNNNQVLEDLLRKIIQKYAQKFSHRQQYFGLANNLDQLLSLDKVVSPHHMMLVGWLVCWQLDWLAGWFVLGVLSPSRELQKCPSLLPQVTQRGS